LRTDLMDVVTSTYAPTAALDRSELYYLPEYLGPPDEVPLLLTNAASGITRHLNPINP